MKLNFSNHFQALADRYGDCEALVHAERDRRYTYDEFHRLSNQIVNMMTGTLDLGFGDRYINLLNQDNMSLIHVPTIFKGPATCAWTNFRDSLDEHAWQVDRGQPRVAFIEISLLETRYDMLHDKGITIVCMDPIDSPPDGVLSFWDLVNEAPEDNPNIELDDREHPALIRFTGGTTGTGKPAVYCIDNWMGLRDSIYALPDADWDHDARMVHLAPISHGSGMFVIPTFYAGGCTVLINEPDLVKYCKVIQDERCTHAMLVPTLMYRLLDVPEASEYDLSTLQTMFYGAAPMSPSKLKDLQSKFGNIFVQAYGSTEHFALALSMSKAAHRATTPEEEKRLASAGQPTAGVEVIVVDDDGNQVQRGEIGEFWLRSRGVCLGYLDDPEKTEQEFSDGFWKSGDLGYMDEGGFGYIVDRKKDMIISGGFNVYATEVEAAINAHKAIVMSAVVGVPHEEWGEAIHAEVMVRDGAEVTEAELIAFVKQNLTSYKAPKTVTVVDELPVSSVGKVLRRNVREKYWKSVERRVG